MSLLKSKQIQLANPGDIIVANSSSTGENLPKGMINTVLTAISNTIHYAFVNALRDSTSGNAIVTAQDGTGTGGENIVISNTPNQVTITAENTTKTGDVDVVIMPQGNGQVYIGNSGNSVLQGEDNDNLTIMGGNATVENASGANLILGGGNGNGTGSNGLVMAPNGYTAQLATAPTDTFATVGYVGNQLNLVSRSEKQEDNIIVGGNNTNFIFNISYAPYGDIEIIFNGAVLEKASYTVSGTTNQTIQLNDSQMGYSAEPGDIVTARYLRQA